MGSKALTPSRGREKRPLGLAALWLLFLGPFFFLTYGFANNMAAQRPHVGSVVFGWELHHIPFIAMFLLPYMSIDAFYGLSLFLARTKTELHTHAKRLLLATLVSVICFLMFPLRTAFVKPLVTGFNGVLLNALTNFDKPFNEAPSLHISLLIILWVWYAARLDGVRRRLLDFWFLLIGLSVLFTWQHHFLDVPTGALVGFGVLYCLPDTVFLKEVPNASPSRLRLSLVYLVGATACVTGSFLGGTALWLLWPAVSLLLVALGYAYIGGSVFQKQENGAHTLASRVLFAPYLVAARVNKWLHLKNNLRKWEFAGLTIRSHPKSFGAHEQSLDLCAEVSGEVAPAAPYVSLPWLDLVPPSPKALTAAMSAIERLQKTGPVSVNCALGVGRSALVAVAWSLHTWQYRSVTDAINAAKSQCPSIALSPESIAMLHRWWTPVL